MSDVYVLASPSPVLWVYPSQVHPSPPEPPSSGGGGTWEPRSVHRWEPDPDPVDWDEEDALALLLLGAL